MYMLWDLRGDETKVKLIVQTPPGRRDSYSVGYQKIILTSQTKKNKINWMNLSILCLDRHAEKRTFSCK